MLHPKLRRLVAIAVLLMLSLSALNLVQWLWGNARTLLEDQEDLRFRHQQLLDRSTMLSVTPTEVITNMATDIERFRYWSGSVSEGELKLQTQVSQLLNELGVTFDALRLQPATRNGMIVEIAADLSGYGHEAMIYRMIEEIERWQPLVIVDRLVLNAQAYSTSEQEHQEHGVLVKFELRVKAFGRDEMQTP